MTVVPPFLLKTSENANGVDASVFKGIEQAILADRPAFLSKFFADFYNVDLSKGRQISEEMVRASWSVGVSASPIASFAFRADLGKIDIPTLVIHGDSDRILPIAATGKPAHEMIAGSKLIVVEDGPHGITWTHASQVNNELLSFLKD